MFSWFRRPGTASTFTPTAGIVQECKTSVEVTKLRTWKPNGREMQLSTSKRRIELFSLEFKGIMYESNSLSGKSEYSYLQYHWCPNVFNVIKGLYTSSIRYRIRIEGNPIAKRMAIGATVQNSSTSWASSICKLRFLFAIVLIRLKPTIEIIKIKMSRVWLWKKFNCSIMGEFLSWKQTLFKEGIFKGEKFSLMNFKLSTSSVTLKF